MSMTTAPILGLSTRVSAIFDSRKNAEQAIQELRRMGLSDAHVSIVARHGDETQWEGDGTVTDHAGDTAERVGKGAVAGASVGALFGLAAVAIPGVGPFITAGWLASLLGITGGAAASGAIVGGTSGAIAGAFAKAGYEEDEAHYYSSAVERGDIFVAVDTANSSLSPFEVRDVLYRHGGRSALNP